MKLIFLFFVYIALAGNSVAQNTGNSKSIDVLKNETSKNIQAGYEVYKKVALNIWEYAELGYKEFKSTLLLQNILKENGFNVEAGVAGIPTAFVASYGSGTPVIGILAEFDALPGLSQNNSATKTPVANNNNGHGCGHHLFGTGSVAAGIAIKQLLKDGTIKGTVKVFGCPAEEGGAGKVYMVREGLFKKVDVVIHWHPSDENSVTLAAGSGSPDKQAPAIRRTSASRDLFHVHAYDRVYRPVCRAGVLGRGCLQPADTPEKHHFQCLRPD